MNICSLGKLKCHVRQELCAVFPVDFMLPYSSSSSELYVLLRFHISVERFSF